jgi:hypothetical protein
VLFFIALIVLFLAYVGATGRLREALLRASVVWGYAAVAWVELLGSGSAIDVPTIATLWIVAGALLAPVLYRWRRPILDAFSRPRERGWVAGVFVTFFALALTTALASPPNTWDSLTYHLPRVEQWVQNRSLAHFPSNLRTQLMLAPGAEALLLHARLLSGGDRLLNVVQYVGYVVGVAGAALVAGRLGARPPGQVLAGLFALTLPMAVLQASSTQNDLLAACWTVAFVERLLAFRDRPGRVVAAEMGAALGLALVTKGTAVVAVAPFCLVLGLLLVRLPWRKAVPVAVALVVLVLAVNVGWLVRNHRAFDNPLGTLAPVVGNARHGPDVVYSNLVRNLASELYTPVAAVNRIILSVSLALHSRAGLDASDGATSMSAYLGEASVPARSRAIHEDFAANPVHVALALVCAGLLVGRRRARADRPVVWFCAAVLAGIGLYCLTFRWQLFGTRLHLPSLLLLGAIVGVTMDRWRPAWRTAVAVVLAGAGLPALLANETRPLLPPPLGGGSSVWSTPREQLLFRGDSGLETAYRRAITLIAQRSPGELGLVVRTGSFEYPIWYLLRQERAGPRVVHAKPLPELDLPHPVRPVSPDMILAVDEEPEPARLARAYGCAYREVGRAPRVVVLERTCPDVGARTRRADPPEYSRFTGGRPEV